MPDQTIQENPDTGGISMVIADHHGIVREGVAAYCATRPDLSIAAQCADGAEALEVILRLQPDFAVLETDLPSLTGLEVTRSLKAAGCPTRVLILTSSRDEALVRDALAAGVDGYLLKQGPARHLFEAISYVNDGGQYLTPLIRRESLTAARADILDDLSGREREVFSALVAGTRPKDIAHSLQISPKTVDTYRASVMRKLRVTSIAGLVRLAIEENLQPAAK